MAGVIRTHQAQIVFLPYPEDAHPDHRATTRIVEDARFDAKLTKTDLPGEPTYPKWLIYYYCMHLRWTIDPEATRDHLKDLYLSVAIGIAVGDHEPSKILARVVFAERHERPEHQKAFIVVVR